MDGPSRPQQETRACPLCGADGSHHEMTGEEMTEDGTTGGAARRPAAVSARPTRPSGGGVRAALTAQDVRRLTLFKWRYSLESAGFSSQQAEQLLFLKWLHARRGPLG